MKRKTNVEMSSNLLEFHEKRKQEALEYFMTMIESIVPVRVDHGGGMESMHSPLTQMKKLFELAQIGKEEPRWLKRIKTLETRILMMQDIGAGTADD